MSKARFIAFAAALGLITASAKAQGVITIQPNIGVLERPEYALFSPGNRVLATSDAKRIKIWDLETGRLLRSLEHFAYNTSLVFTPDGKSIFAGYKDGSVRLWDVETGALTATVEVARVPEGEVPEGVPALAIDAKRQLLLAGTGGGKIVGLSLAKQQKLFSIDFGKDGDQDGSVVSLGLSEDGGQLAALSRWGTAKWFDLQSRKVIRSVKLLSKDIYPSKDIYIEKYLGTGLFLARSSAAGCKAEAWIAGVSEGKAKLDQISAPVSCPKEDDTAAGEEKIFTHAANGDLYISRDRVPGLEIWDLKTRSLKRRLSWPDGSRGSVIAISGDLAFAAVIERQTMTIRRLDTGAAIRGLSTQGYQAQTAFLSGDGQTMVLVKSYGTSKRLVKLQVGSASPVFSTHSSKENVIYYGLSETQGTLVALEKDGVSARELTIADVNDGRVTARMPIPEGEDIWAARISPDGGRVVVFGDKFAKLIDAASGRELLTIPGQLIAGEPPRVASAIFSPDSKRLAVGFYGSTEIWDITSLRLVKRFADQEEETCTSLMFLNDGRSFLCGSRDGPVYHQDIGSGRMIRSYKREVIAGHVNAGSVAVSKDGTLIAAGPGQRAVSTGDIGRETGIHVWNAATGKLRFMLRGHEANIYALAFTPDGRWLMSGSLDGTIRYWDMTSGALAATFASAYDGRWVMISARGFFAASADAGDLLSAVKGYRAVSISQLWQSLYNPDLLRATLDGDPSGEAADAAKIADLESVLTSGEPPAVSIAVPSSVTEAETVTATIGIKVQRGGIGRIEWRLNGVTAGVAYPGPDAGPELTETRQLALDPGSNTIDVLAYNRANLLSSLPARAHVRYESTREPQKPTLHIIAIGIDAYIDRGWVQDTGSTLVFPPLNLAVKDAVVLSDSLKQAARGLYADVKITHALDSAATRDNLERVIGEAAAAIASRDTVILYAAAHGVSADGKFFLIPQDFDGGPNPAVLPGRAIGQDRIQDWLANRIRAKRVILLLDTCESGALIAGHLRARTQGSASDAAVGRLHEATGRPVLTAAALGQGALEGRIAGSSDRHGLFTWAILQALRNADRNGNGTIELSELAAYVQDAVPELAAALGGAGRAAAAVPRSAGTEDSGQTARFGSHGEDFTLVQKLP
jgi:WD40 repeat protein